jgi:hypothetical protein
MTASGPLGRRDFLKLSAGAGLWLAVSLGDPDEVRRSRKDATVLLFYRGGPLRWTCAVTKVEGGEGFLVTAYPTDAIKIGETIWTRSR